MKPSSLLAGLLATSLLWMSPAPAMAEPLFDEATRASSLMTESGVQATAGATDQRIWLDDTKRPVAPGIELRSFRWLDADGFMRGDLLTVDLGSGKVNLDYLFPGVVAKGEPVSTMADREGAVAAVNGDFFDINNSNAPQGPGLSRDGVVKGPNPGTGQSIGVDTTGIARLTSLFLEASLTTPSGTLKVDGLNQAAIPAEGIGAFTSQWGSYTRTRVTGGAARVKEVIVSDGVVTSLADAAGAGQLPDNQIAFVGRNAGADALGALKVGDKVSFDYKLKNDGEPMKVAVGGGVRLVSGGKVVPQSDKAVHPRTAAGFSADGRTMYLLTVDGRSAESRGMSYTELGSFMAEVGASEAINLDGGGSSTLVAREAGESKVDIENEPSDGHERHDPNGLALFAAPGSGNLTGMRMITELDDDDADLLKVFPGLHRELEALGYDETYASVAASPTYKVSDGPGSIDADGTFLSKEPGHSTITATMKFANGKKNKTAPKHVKATTELTVLGQLDRMRASVDKVTLLDPAKPATFQIIGSDRHGFEALIEPGDVKLSYDSSVISVTPNDKGGFTVKAIKDAGTAVVTMEVQGVKSYLPVAMGAVSTVIDDFSKPETWRFTQARAAGSVEPATGYDAGPALKMNYDFTKATATRVGYARPAAPMELEGQPLAIGAWIYGSGQGEWTGFGIIDGTGKAQALYGPYITWTGWKYVEVQVPQTLQTPIQLNYISIIETKAARQYTGSVIIDDVTVKSSPAVKTPTVAPRQDPVVQQHTALNADGEKWNFAVVSDAQFTAKNPGLVPAARRTLQEAVAADPEFVVILGDFVDTGYPEDMALAKKVIDEELTGKVDWYYVPGNHEIYGTNSSANFTATFGDTHRTFDHNGTRFVLLDSSKGSLLSGGFDQWQMFRGALDGAKADPSINGVVAMWHHPPRDPSALKNSQLTNRVEAALVEDWLADFREETGKGAAFVGAGVGAFSANSVDAVPYIVNGNMGKSPSTSVIADGGFSGWSLFAVDPTVTPTPGEALYQADPASPDYRPWLKVEMRPHVDALELTAPASLTVGQSADVSGKVTQHGRTFEIEYPISAAWGGQGVFVGSATAAGEDAVVAYDPSTKKVTGVRAGTAELTLTVNGTSQKVTITVA